MFTFIWMQMTAPMKNEIMSTMPIESTPSFCISLTYCFQNMRNRSGRENTLAAYKMAVENKMKLFSYGDGMLIL